MSNAKVNGILGHREECEWENPNVAQPKVSELFITGEKYLARVDSAVFDIG